MPKRDAFRVRKRSPLKRDTKTRYRDPITGKVAKETGKVLKDEKGRQVGGYPLTKHRKVDRLFFRPERIYAHGQPTITFSREHYALFDYEIQELKRRLANVKLVRTLEFGGADKPISSHLNSGEYTFCDISNINLALTSSAHERVAANNKGKLNLVSESLETWARSNSRDNFDLIVASEVFTHILPEQRYRLIGQLAESGNRLVVIDRYVTSLTAVLQKYKDSDFLMQKQRQYLHPRKIAKRLAKMGFAVELHLYPTGRGIIRENFYWGYFRPYAEQSDKPGLKIIETTKAQEIPQDLSDAILARHAGKPVRVIGDKPYIYKKLYPKPKKD